MWIKWMALWINARCRGLFVVQQLNLNQQILILYLILELMKSPACFALSGPGMPKLGLFDQETTVGRPVIQFQKLFGMVVMLCTFSIVLAETMNSSGDCHFQWLR